MAHAKGVLKDKRERQPIPSLNSLYPPFALLPFGQWVFDKSPFAPIFSLAYKKESIDYFSSVSSSSIQHYLRKKINKIE